MTTTTKQDAETAGGKVDGDNDSVENNTAGSGLQSEDNAKGSAVSTGPDPEMKPSPKQVGLHPAPNSKTSFGNKREPILDSPDQKAKAAPDPPPSFDAVTSSTADTLETVRDSTGSVLRMKQQWSGHRSRHEVSSLLTPRPEIGAGGIHNETSVVRNNTAPLSVQLINSESLSPGAFHVQGIRPRPHSSQISSRSSSARDDLPPSDEYGVTGATATAAHTISDAYHEKLVHAVLVNAEYDVEQPTVNASPSPLAFGEVLQSKWKRNILIGAIVLAAVVALTVSLTQLFVNHSGDDNIEDSNDPLLPSDNSTMSPTVPALPDNVRATALGSPLLGSSLQGMGASCRLSKAGDRLIVGIPGSTTNDQDNKGNSTVGQVRVYAWNVTAADWQMLGDPIYGAMADVDFGRTVAMAADGTTVAVSAQAGAASGIDYNDLLNAGRVALYVYNATQRRWIQRGKDLMGGFRRDFDGVFAFDQFGFSLDINGDGHIVVVGSPGEVSRDTDGSLPADRGYIEVFEYQEHAKAWQQRGAKIQHTSGRGFGHTVHISDGGDIVMASAFNDAGDKVEIRAHIWDDRTRQWWTQTVLEIPKDVNQHRFDTSMDAQASTLGVSLVDQEGGPVVYVYTYDATERTWESYPEPFLPTQAQIDFGSTLAVSKDGFFLAISGYTNFAEIVQVYRFDFRKATWGLYGQYAGEWNLSPSFGMSLAISGDGFRVASGVPGLAKVWTHELERTNEDRLCNSKIATVTVDENLAFLEMYVSTLVNDPMLGSMALGQLKTIVQYDVDIFKICGSCITATTVVADRLNSSILDDHTYASFGHYCDSNFYGYDGLHSSLLMVPKTPVSGSFPSGKLRTFMSMHTYEATTRAPTILVPSNITETMQDVKIESEAKNLQSLMTLIDNSKDIISLLIATGSGALGIAPDYIGYGASLLTHNRTLLYDEMYMQAASVAWISSLDYICTVSKGCTALATAVTLQGGNEGAYASVAAGTAFRRLGFEVLSTFASIPLFDLEGLTLDSIAICNNDRDGMRVMTDEEFFVLGVGIPSYVYAASIDVPGLANSFTGQKPVNPAFNVPGDTRHDLISWFASPGKISSQQVLDMVPPYLPDVIEPNILDLFERGLAQGIASPCSSPDLITPNVTDKFCEYILDNSIHALLVQADFDIVLCTSPDDTISTVARQTPESIYSSNPHVTKYPGFLGQPTTGNHMTAFVQCMIAPLEFLLSHPEATRITPFDVEDDEFGTCL